ncbi:MAG: RtcB family protein [Bacteroidetes bacterium]|nr:MAG: RtcB family protein [Bacteroidota bacterium]
MAKIKTKHLLRIGFEQGEALKLALAAMAHDKMAHKGREVKLGLLQDLLREPEKYRRHQILGPVVEALHPAEPDPDGPVYPELRPEPLPYRVFGAKGIEAGARQQMEVAARLPVARGAALMPDGHQGYGLPIGGVLATEGAIIPYAVGVDIGCRMCMTVYDLPETHLKRYHTQLKQDLLTHTTFGAGNGPENPMDDPVLDRPEFREDALLRGLKDKAWRQIGSSGSGNHFVEYGVVEILSVNNEWGVAPGRYLAILSHSGSRGLGAQIAGHYTKVAMDKTRLPKEARHLAWLELDSEAGAAYWQAMNLAGAYASACHHHIHHRLGKALGEKPLFMVENHHNFAWKEQLPDGSGVIVHRKGATPAGPGVLGIIPGSMTAPGFIVRGKGENSALQSASHGAGRQMSRSKARSSYTRSAMRKYLSEQGVTLLGGGLDEAPMAYKDIHAVMAAQTELVEVLGQFWPRIVRMADE